MLPIFVLNEKPLIIYVKGWMCSDLYIQFWRDLILRCSKVELVLMISPSWYVGEKLGIYPWVMNNIYSLSPSNLRVVFLANDHGEFYYFSSVGAEVYVINQLAFLDYNIYKPIHGVGRQYSAVYNAQMQPFKRHNLLAHVDKAALITYGKVDQYCQKILNDLPTCTIMNEIVNDKFIGLSWESVNKIYSMSQVGVCLSSEEGAMYAAGEYLLSGLPVVTTVNKGGRDYFFDGRFVIHVDDSSSQIASAVNFLASENFDRMIIRDSFIDKAIIVRDRFINLVNTICVDYGEPCDFSLSFKEIFKNKLLGSDADFVRLDKVLDLLKGNYV